MNTKEHWIDSFEELLWQHHTCDWDAGNRNPDYPYQLAIAYLDFRADSGPNEAVGAAFKRYLESLE